jgi:hypothetical protein
MNRNVEPGVALEIIERRRESLDWFVIAGECHSQRGHDADGVFIAAFQHLLGR